MIPLHLIEVGVGEERLGQRAGPMVAHTVSTKQEEIQGLQFLCVLMHMYIYTMYIYIPDIEFS